MIAFTFARVWCWWSGGKGRGCDGVVAVGCWGTGKRGRDRRGEGASKEECIMGRGGRWVGGDVGWGMVINIYSARLCLCGEGRRGGGEREGSSSFNKFPSTLPKTSPTLSTTSPITTSKSMSTDLKPSQSVTTSQQSPAKTKTLLVDVGVDGSGGRVSAGVD